MRSLHNIEPALKTKPFAYRGYAADGTVYHIERDSRGWCAHTPDFRHAFHKKTLAEVSAGLESLRAS